MNNTQEPTTEQIKNQCIQWVNELVDQVQDIQATMTSRQGKQYFEINENKRLGLLKVIEERFAETPSEEEQLNNNE